MHLMYLKVHRCWSHTIHKSPHVKCITGGVRVYYGGVVHFCTFVHLNICSLPIKESAAFKPCNQKTDTWGHSVLLLAFLNVGPLSKTIQNYSKLSKTIKNFPKLSKIIQNYPKLSKSSQNYSKLSKVLRSQSKLS